MLLAIPFLGCSNMLCRPTISHDKVISTFTHKMIRPTSKDIWLIGGMHEDSSNWKGGRSIRRRSFRLPFIHSFGRYRFVDNHFVAICVTYIFEYEWCCLHYKSLNYYETRNWLRRNKFRRNLKLMKWSSVDLTNAGELIFDELNSTKWVSTNSSSTKL